MCIQNPHLHFSALLSHDDGPAVVSAKQLVDTEIAS